MSLDLIAFLIVLGGSIFAMRKVIGLGQYATQEQTGDRPTIWHIQLGLLFVPSAILLAALGFHLGYPELKGL